MLMCTTKSSYALLNFQHGDYLCSVLRLKSYRSLSDSRHWTTVITVFWRSCLQVNICFYAIIWLCLSFIIKNGLLCLLVHILRCSFIHTHGHFTPYQFYLGSLLQVKYIFPNIKIQCFQALSYFLTFIIFSLSAMDSPGEPTNH